MLTKNIEADREKEIRYIFELLQEVMKEEGYNIPNEKYADRGYKSFEIPLRNPMVKNEKLTIKIGFNEWD